MAPIDDAGEADGEREVAVEGVCVEGKDAAEEGVGLGGVEGGCVFEVAVEGYGGVVDVVDVGVVGSVAGWEAGCVGVRWGLNCEVVGADLLCAEFLSLLI